MIRTATLAITSVAFSVLLSAAPASGQVFFNMDYSAGAAPVAGWGGAVPTSATHTRTRIPGGGPQGDDVYELTQLYTGSAVQGYGGEFYWGWNGNIEAQNPAQGARRFYRWRLRFSPTTNFRGIYLDGSQTTLTNKILMVGDGCGRNTCRVIVSYRGGDNGRQASFLRVALDGGEVPADTPPLNVGEWIDIQIELDSSSSTSSSDGAFKIWINNNDYSRPTAQRTGIQLNPVNWRYVSLGAYENNGLQSGGVHSFRIAGFQAATSFDSAWSRASTLPGTPNNLRIIPPQ